MMYYILITCACYNISHFKEKRDTGHSKNVMGNVFIIYYTFNTELYDG